MYYDQLAKLKESIATEIVNPRVKMPHIFSLYSPLGAVHVRSVRQIRNAIIGTGIASGKSDDAKIKIYLDNYIDFDPRTINRYFGLDSDKVIYVTGRPIELQWSPYGNATRHRPPFPGVSVGHPRGMTGTFGAVVEDKEGIRYLLGNNHILARANRGKRGDIIIQPGKHHDGNRADAIAHLSRFIPVSTKKANFYDAAIAQLLDQTCSTNINGFGGISSVGQPNFGNVLRLRYNQSLEQTEGKITTLDVSYRVVFDERIVSFNSLFEIQAANADPMFHRFSKEGDSGSLIIDKDTRAVVGLLFAAGEGENGYFSLACPIEGILNEFNVTLV